VRPRRRKAFEQADGQRDRFQEVRRRGIGWEDHQRRQSRVRVQYGSDMRFSDMEDLDEFDTPVQTYDGRVALQYSRPGRTGKETHRHMAAPSDYYRRSFSKEFHQQLSARYNFSSSFTAKGGTPAAVRTSCRGESRISQSRSSSTTTSKGFCGS